MNLGFSSNAPFHRANRNRLATLQQPRRRLALRFVQISREVAQTSLAQEFAS